MSEDQDLVAPSVPQPTPAVALAAPSSEDQDLVAPNVPPKAVSSTGQTTEPLHGWAFAFKGLSDRWTLGAGALVKGFKGIQLATSDMPFDEAKDGLETQTLLQAQHDKEDYANTHGYWQALGADVFGGSLTEALPTLMTSVGGATIGAGVGALARNPEAGAQAGLALTFGAISAGQTQYDLMERGIDRDHARAGAIASGAANAAMALFGTQSANAAAQGIASGVINSPGFKQAVVKTTLHIAKNLGAQVGLQSANALYDSWIKYMTTRTSNGAKPYTMDEARSDITNAAVQALIVGGEITAGTTLLGGAVGARAKGAADPIKAMAEAIDRQTELLKQEEREKLVGKQEAEPELKATVEQTVEAEPEQPVKTPQERKAERAERQAANKEKFWKAATINPKGKAYDRKAVSSALFKTLSANPLKSVFRSWEGLMQMITQKGTLSTLRDVFDLKAMNSKAWGINQKWRGRFKQLVNEHGVTDSEYAKAINQGEKPSGDLKFGYVDKDGFVKEASLEDPKTGKKYTLLQLMQIRNYLLDQDKDAISRLKRGNGYSYPGEVTKGSSTLEVVEQHLYQQNPNFIKIADAGRVLYREFGRSVVNDALQERWNIELEHNDTYGGALISGTSLADMEREAQRRATVLPGSMHEREGGQVRVPIRGMLDLLDGHIQQFARESSFLQFEQDAKSLFGDQKVRDFLTRNYGNLTMDVIDQYVKDIMDRPREVEGVISKTLNWFRRKAFTMYLGGRPEQYLKQLTGAVHAFQITDAQTVIDAWSFLYAEPKKAAALMNQSPLLRNRSQLFDPDFKPPKTKSIEGLANSLMAGVEVGDAHATYLAAFPAYIAELKRTGSEAKAITAFERAFETTQGSGSVDEMPHIYRSGAMVRMLTIFTQQANRQAEMISVEWDTFVNRPTAENFKKYANTVTIAYAGATLYPLVGWLVMAPFMDSETAERRLKEILVLAPLGPYASLPVWGMLLTPMMIGAYNVVFNEKLGIHEPKSLDLDIAGDLLKDALALMQASDGDSVHVWNAIVASANVLGRITGLPVVQLTKIASPFVGVKK